MLLMVEKGIRERMRHEICHYAEAHKKYIQKLPVNTFEWIQETSQLNEDFIKNYNQEIDEGYFLEVD